MNRPLLDARRTDGANSLVQTLDIKREGGKGGRSLVTRIRREVLGIVIDEKSELQGMLATGVVQIILVGVDILIADERTSRGRRSRKRVPSYARAPCGPSRDQRTSMVDEVGRVKSGRYIGGSQNVASTKRDADRIQ